LKVKLKGDFRLGDIEYIIDTDGKRVFIVPGVNGISIGEHIDD